MKRYVLTLISCMAFAAVYAESFTDNGFRFNVLDEEAQICELSNIGSITYGKDIWIPSSAYYRPLYYKVVKIGDQAAANRLTAISAVVLPETIEEIGEFAFRYTRVDKLYLPASVKKLGNGALYSSNTLLSELHIYDLAAFCNMESDEYDQWGNSSYAYSPLYNFKGNLFLEYYENYIPKSTRIEELNIPEGVEEIKDHRFCSFQGTSATFPEGLTRIGEYSFYGSTIKNVSFPSTLSEVGQRAFYQCSNLEYLYLYNTRLTTIPKYFARGCDLSKGLDLPKNIISIGDEAFASTKLRILHASRYFNLENIGYSAFDGCTELEEADLSKSPLHTIGTWAFRNCPKLKITLPEQMDSIGAYAFSGCGFKNLSIPEGIRTISNEVLSYNENLESVTLPSTTKWIKASAFNYCTELSQVYCYSVEPPTWVFEITDFWGNILERYIRKGIDFSTMTLHVPKGSLYAYARSDGYWKLFGDIIDDLEVKSAITDIVCDKVSSAFDLYDLSGRMAKAQATDEDLKSLAPGIYILKNGTDTRKIIIK